jgi:hypothetical protein
MVDIANIFFMVMTLQDFASGGTSSSVDGTGSAATQQEVLLALLYMLKCSTVTVFFMASTLVRHEITFRRMFCPMDRTHRRRRLEADAKVGGGRSRHSDVRTKMETTQAQHDSFQFNLAATGYLYLVLLLWDSELALSFEHFLDVNYGPVFFVALLSLVKVVFSIEVNFNNLSEGGSTSSSTNVGATNASAHRSLSLNLAHTGFVLVFLAAIVWKRFEAGQRFKVERRVHEQHSVVVAAEEEAATSAATRRWAREEEEAGKRHRVQPDRRAEPGAESRPEPMQLASERGSLASQALRKAGASTLVGQRLRVFDDSNQHGRVGTVMGVRRALGSSTKHIIVFEDGDGAPQTVLLQKTSAAKGYRFHLLPPADEQRHCEVLQAVDSVHDKIDKVQQTVARMELTMQAVLETSCATGRLVAALALGELDCPKYVYIVPDTPPGGWKKGVFWFHNLHATQVRLVLACAHDFQVVRCGPDGMGYPIKLEKDWVKKFFHTFGPIIKIGLFAARAAALASGVGVFHLLPPHDEPGNKAVTERTLTHALEGQSEHMHQLHLIDEMLEKFGEMAEGGAEAAEAHEELDHVLESAAEADREVYPAASEALQAWTASSYRSLRALLCAQDPHLAQTGLLHAVAGGASEWVAPENVAAWTAQQQQSAVMQ